MFPILKLFVYYKVFLLKICLKMFKNERRKGIFSLMDTLGQ